MTSSEPLSQSRSDQNANDVSIDVASAESAVAAENATLAESAAADYFAGKTALEVAANPVSHPEFDQFVATIAALRAPQGCPWDREQTHQSIADNMIEEAYEAVDAIEANDIAHMREELGDVLLQVVLQSQMAAEAGEFTLEDVAHDVNAKIVRRHPHVFGDVEAGSASEVLDVWDAIKLKEKQGTTSGVEADSEGEVAGDGNATPKLPGVLDSVPASFPALIQAQKLSRKAAAAGFEWESVKDVWGKVHEEAAELQEAYAAAPHAANGKVDRDGEPTEEMLALGLSADDAVAAVEEEFGDLLFTLVNVARKMGVNAEGSLRAACTKFRRRWTAMEKLADEQGKSIEVMSTVEQNELWNAVKTEE